MKSLLPLRVLYSVAFLYDGLLGLAFIAAGPQLFQLAGITPPNHWGYVHFAAGTLVIFGWMFLQIARDPLANRGLVIYGVLLKACYVATVLWSELQGGIPMLWKWFAAFDLLFLVLFLWSWARLKATADAARVAGPTG